MRNGGAQRITVVLVAGVLLMSGSSYAADRQIRPFLGATFGAGTTFVDLDDVIGEPNRAIGASAVFLGEVFGAEVDVADAPGFFESDGKHLVLGSRVTTISGNVVVAAPRKLTEYSLRPYFVGGGGLMRITTTTASNVFDISSVIPAIDVGAGVVGFVTNRVGVCWEIRRFQGIGSTTGDGLTWTGEERLSFWRATMAVAIRY
jgi:hypothetical protein